MLITLAFAGFVWLPQTACGAGTLADRVLVVYDRGSRESEDIARHYASMRHVPAGNLCAIKLSKPDLSLLPNADYEREVRGPIAACLEKAGKEKILYIVLAYLRPFRVDPGGLHVYAMDSYLADIWDFYNSRPFDPLPRFVHPYYADNGAMQNKYGPFVSLAEYRSHGDSELIYAVWRLDGPSWAIARALVDKAMKTEAAHGPAGQACIDERDEPGLHPYSGSWAGDWDLFRAARFLEAAGFKVVEDKLETEFGTPPSGKCPGAALYSGWYKYNNYNDAFTWNEGAIGFHMDSGSLQDPRGGDNWGMNALKRGITVTSGAVTEPYLIGLPRPDGVFHDLLAGSNVGDAFLRNTRFLKWMIENVGDPLYTPFPGGRGPLAHH